MTSPTALRRTLSTRDLIMYGLAYLAPVAPLTNLGFIWDASNGLIAAAYLVAALCILFTAKAYALMVNELPTAGSVYGYTQLALGRFAGFVAGWMILLDYLLLPALVYALVAVGLETLMPDISRAFWICATVVITFTINWFGVSVTAKVSIVSVVIQVVVVVAVSALCLWALYAGPDPRGLSMAPLYSAHNFKWASLFSGAGVCMVAYLGFDAVSTLAEEVREDQIHTIGRAILIVLILATLMFTMASWVLGDLMVDFKVKDPAAAVYEVMAANFGVWAATSLAWIIVLVVGFSNAVPIQVGVARILFAMGRDGSLPNILGKIHPKTATPYVSMLVSTGLSLVIALTLRDSLELLATMVSLGAMTGFAFLHISVIKYLGMNAHRHRFLTHWFMPTLGLAGLFVIIFSMSLQALYAGLIWLALGLSYWAFFKK
jgi:amino acid transporter